MFKTAKVYFEILIIHSDLKRANIQITTDITQLTNLYFLN